MKGHLKSEMVWGAPFFIALKRIKMKDVFEYKDCEIVSESLPLSFKDIDGRKGIVTGYFANFNSVDGEGDVVKPGSFTKSISESGPTSRKPRIKHILNHDWTQPLGVLTELREDSKGLYYESQLGNHALGVDFVKMVDSGLITEHSFGYRTIKYNQVTDWADWKQGDVARELTELKMYEGSPLTFLGMNPNTPLLGLKSGMEIDRMGKRIELIIKSLRSGTFTDETFELLEIELKQLQQLFIDLSKKPVDKSTSSEPAPATQTTPVKRTRNFSQLKNILTP